MFKPSIKNRVYKVIDEKLKEAQLKHEEHCKQIDQEAEEAKNSHLDSTVDSFVGKFL